MVFNVARDVARSAALWKLNRVWRKQQGRAPSSVGPLSVTPGVILPSEPPKAPVDMDEFFRLATEKMKRDLKDEGEEWKP
jgi:hypothetical protein